MKSLNMKALPAGSLTSPPVLRSAQFPLCTIFWSTPLATIQDACNHLQPLGETSTLIPYLFSPSGKSSSSVLCTASTALQFSRHSANYIPRVLQLHTRLAIISNHQVYLHPLVPAITSNPKPSGTTSSAYMPGTLLPPRTTNSTCNPRGLYQCLQHQRPAPTRNY